MSYHATQSKNWALAPGVADARVIPENPRRVRLVCYPPVAGRYSIAFGEPAVLDSGPTVFSGGHPVEFDIDDDGEAIRHDVHVIASAGSTAGAIEFYTP